MTGNSDSIDEHQLKEVTDLFCAEMRLSSIKPDDDFFDLGGDSLMAESLITAVNVKFDTSLDVSNILDYPTPLELARYLSNKLVSGEFISTLSNSSGSENLLYMHGPFGNNYHLRLVGDKIKSRWKIFGIRARGSEIDEKPHKTLTALMDDYMKLVHSYFGGYPKYIFGSCGGGIFALQLARRIYDETGQRMNVMIVDPPPVFLMYHQEKKWYRTRIGPKLRVVGYNICLEILTSLGFGKFKKARRLRNLTLHDSLSELTREIYPDPFPCNLLLFVGGKQMDDSALGFQRWANDDVLLRMLPIAGPHLEIEQINRDLINNEAVSFFDEVSGKNVVS